VLTVLIPQTKDIDLQVTLGKTRPKILSTTRNIPHWKRQP
jgi:hypothetical protein